MTGRYLIPFCKKPFYLSTHTCPFRRLTPPPSPTSGDGLRLAYFRLFSDKRGQLAVYVLFFFAKTSFNTTSKHNSLLPSFLSGGQNRNDDERKNIMWLLAKNPARDTHKCVYKYKTRLFSSLVSASPEHGGKCRACEAKGASLSTQVKICKSCILCQILHSTPYFFVSLFLTVFFLRSRMTGRYLLPFCKKLFYLSAHTCPFRHPGKRLFLCAPFPYFLFCLYLFFCFRA